MKRAINHPPNDHVFQLSRFIAQQINKNVRVDGGMNARKVVSPLIGQINQT